MNNEFISTIEEIIEDQKLGKMVIMVDDEDRENEGDLIIPAAKVDDKAINFMATHGRGLICLSLTEDRVKELNLPLMSQNNDSRDSTAFTISIEAKEGLEITRSLTSNHSNKAWPMWSGQVQFSRLTPNINGFQNPFMNKAVRQG